MRARPPPPHTHTHTPSQVPPLPCSRENQTEDTSWDEHTDNLQIIFSSPASFSSSINTSTKNTKKYKIKIKTKNNNNKMVLFWVVFVLSIRAPQGAAMLVHSSPMKSRKKIGSWCFGCFCHKCLPCLQHHWNRLLGTQWQHSLRLLNVEFEQTEWEVNLQ